MVQIRGSTPIYSSAKDCTYSSSTDFGTVQQRSSGEITMYQRSSRCFAKTACPVKLDGRLYIPAHPVRRGFRAACLVLRRGLFWLLFFRKKSNKDFERKSYSYDKVIFSRTIMKKSILLGLILKRASKYSTKINYYRNNGNPVDFTIAAFDSLY
jgi:hypothetical protein